MLVRLLLLFTVVPLMELGLLIWIDKQTSLAFTLALVLITGIVGGSLARREGLRCFARFRRETVAGRLPADSLLDGLMILVAGALLITPGVLTDVVGFSLLIPGVRTIIKRRLKSRIEMQFHAVSPHAPWNEPPEGDQIIDTRVIDVDPNDPTE